MKKDFSWLVVLWRTKYNHSHIFKTTRQKCSNKHLTLEYLTTTSQSSCE